MPSPSGRRTAKNTIIALCCVRGETCSLPCAGLLFCTMSEGRRVIFLAWGCYSAQCQREDCNLWHWEGVWSLLCQVPQAPFVGICSFVRCKVSVSNTKKTLIRGRWFGTSRPGTSRPPFKLGHLPTWILWGLLDLVLLSLSCRFGHLSAWFLWGLLGLVLLGLSCRFGHLLALFLWGLLGLVLLGLSCRFGHLSAWFLWGLLGLVLLGLSTCQCPYDTQAPQAWVVVEVRRAL